MFNWGELKCWGTSESALTRGRMVNFKERSPLGIYRWWFIGTFSLTCPLMLLISVLLSKRIKRKEAEAAASRATQELPHVVRVSTVGGLARGLSHETNQPLMAILSNAEAVQHMLTVECPDLNNEYRGGNQPICNKFAHAYTFSILRR